MYKHFTIFLFLIIVSQSTYASVCESTFAGPVGTIDGGELKLKDNSKLINTYNGTVYTDNLSKNNGDCDGGSCTASGTVLPSLSFAIDLGDESDGELKVESDTTLNSDKNYEKVEIKENKTLTLQGDITIRVKNTFKLEKDSDKLVIDGNVTLYVKKFELGKNATVEIKEGASLIVYVDKDTKIEKNSSIDTKNHPENFILLAEGKIDIKDEATCEGFFYTNGDLKVGKNAEITGAVTGKKVEIKDKAQITYDEAAAQKLEISGVCTLLTPIADYHFDSCAWDGTDGEVIDSSGNDNNGTTHNDTLLVDGHINNAAKFSGGEWDNAQTITAPEILDTQNDFTISFWINIHNLDTSKDWTGVFSKKVEFYIYKEKALHINMKNKTDVNGQEAFSSENNIIDTDAWHHVAIRSQGKNIKIYLDGNIIINEQMQYQKVTDTKTLELGKTPWSGSLPFDGQLDEMKFFALALTDSQIHAIYDNESSHKNYDGSDRAAVDCSESLPPASFFDLWNTTGNISDRNISTKIAAQPFNLTLAALDEENNGYQDFNGTVCTQIVDAGDGNSAKSGWVKTLFTETNISTVTFNIPTAIQNARVKIAWKRNSDTGCPLADEDNSTLSSDNFAVRPQKFVFLNIPSGKLTAEHGYTFKAVAVNADGTTPTPDYNTTITPLLHKYFRDGSDGSAMDGTFTPATNFSFADGATPDTTLSFDNVGIVGLELNDTTWAAVDSDDTPLAQRRIYQEQNLTFIPAKFSVDFPNAPTMSNHLDGAFTYFANTPATMGANLKNIAFKITALGENDGNMTNYQNPQDTWFANDSDLSVKLQVAENPTLSPEIDEAMNRDLNFTSGVAQLDYGTVQFNYGHEHNTTKPPLTRVGNDANLTIDVRDHTDTAVSGSKLQPFSGSATFYCGRIVTHDVRTSQTPVPGDVTFVIYSPTLLEDFKHYTQNWYINKLDNFSNWHAIAPKSNRNVSSAAVDSTSVSDVNVTSGGVKSFSINASPANKSLKAFYHIDIPAWLWYSKYEDYNFTTGSTCAQHPCFTYIFDSPLEDHGIASGDFKGAAFDNNFTSAPKRKAVKLLR